MPYSQILLNNTQVLSTSLHAILFLSTVSQNHYTT